jgi:hypothetical protein
VLPKAFKPFFQRVNINIDQYIISIPQSVHLALHSGEGFGKGGIWNWYWRTFSEEHPEASPGEIFEFANRLVGWVFHLDQFS